MIDVLSDRRRKTVVRWRELGEGEEGDVGVRMTKHHQLVNQKQMFRSERSTFRVLFFLAGVLRARFHKRHLLSWDLCLLTHPE